jgi:superfamily II DNA or RNA helicase
MNNIIMDCNIYNQYYTDVVINGKIINDRCFKGSSVYNKKFKINSYTDYKSNDYYTWINESFKQYAFPDEKFNDPGYDPDAVYSSICNATEYSLKPQQKFAGRVMNTHTRNKGLLIYHGLGSGKTQTSIVIGEAFKFRNTGDSVIQGRSDALVLIVVPAALVEQYYSEIIGNIENGKIKSASGQILINGDRQYYLDELTRDAISQAYVNIIELENKIKESDGDITEYERKIRLLKKDIIRRKDEERVQVKKVYQIISHETFLNRIFIYSDNEFKPGPYLPMLKVSNGLLIIDEIQNLVSAIGTSYRKLLYAIKFYADQNFRVIALTGTPIYDKPFEFGLLMNLLRPRMQFPDGFEDFNEVFLKDRQTMKNKELFKKMCSGYVSYFKGGNPEAYPFKKTILVEHSMNPYQYSIYKKALLAEVQLDLLTGGGGVNKQEFIVRVHTSESQNDEIATGIFNNSNLFCNIAFPEAKLTPEETKVMTRETLLKAGIREFKSVLRTTAQGGNNFEKILNTVSGFSSKFAKVAELIMLSPGPVFVYSNYVFYGVDAMGTVMSFLGYSEYPDQSGVNGCYFIWKGKADPGEIIKAKQLFNSKENINGKLLRVMFGTQTVMEGVDFKNVRQVHILDPWWNDSRVQQIIARGIRLCSHRDLPSSERYVNVFIHLSTLGSAENMFELKIRKKDPTGLKEIESKVRSFLKLENPDETKSEKWVFREAYITPQGELKNSSSTFLASDIISNSIIKLADPELTRAFGHHKNLDSISVQEYMYQKAMSKLNLNRQFEMAIKEVSIDCSLNKNGNIIRLNEFYKPASVNGLYNLVYENYSTGDFYTRIGLPSTFTMRDILSNVAMKSTNFKFKNVVTSEEITLNKSLILSENIVCGNGEYSFENIPLKIVNLTLNKELIPQLMKLPVSVIKQYFYDVQRKNIPTFDPKLAKAINLFLSKDSLVQKQDLIKKLVELGIGEESVWELYSLDEIKKEYSRLKIKK